MGGDGELDFSTLDHPSSFFTSGQMPNYHASADNAAGERGSKAVGKSPHSLIVSCKDTHYFEYEHIFAHIFAYYFITLTK